MNTMTDTPSKSSAPVFQPGTSDAEIEAAGARAAHQRKLTVYFWRTVILVVFLGGWELAVRLKLMDVFFFSSPVAIIVRLVEIRVAPSLVVATMGNARTSDGGAPTVSGNVSAFQ